MGCFQAMLTEMAQHLLIQLKKKAAFYRRLVFMGRHTSFDRQVMPSQFLSQSSTQLNNDNKLLLFLLLLLPDKPSS